MEDLQAEFFDKIESAMMKRGTRLFYENYTGIPCYEVEKTLEFARLVCRGEEIPAVKLVQSVARSLLPVSKRYLYERTYYYLVEYVQEDLDRLGVRIIIKYRKQGDDCIFEYAYKDPHIDEKKNMLDAIRTLHYHDTSYRKIHGYTYYVLNQLGLLE